MNETTPTPDDPTPPVSAPAPEDPVSPPPPCTPSPPATGHRRRRGAGPASLGSPGVGRAALPAVPGRGIVSAAASSPAPGSPRARDDRRCGGGRPAVRRCGRGDRLRLALISQHRHLDTRRRGLLVERRHHERGRHRRRRRPIAGGHQRCHRWNAGRGDRDHRHLLRRGADQQPRHRRRHRHHGADRRSGHDLSSEGPGLRQRRRCRPSPDRGCPHPAGCAARQLLQRSGGQLDRRSRQRPGPGRHARRGHRHGDSPGPDGHRQRRRHLRDPERDHPDPGEHRAGRTRVGP